MTYHFNVEGSQRKQLAQKISEIIGQPAVYLRVPTCAYQIGSYNISKEGILSWSDIDAADPIHSEESKCLLQALEEAGYCPDEADFFEAQTAALAEIKENTQETEATPKEKTFDGLAISMPRDMFSDEAISNLKSLIEAKGNLMKRAFLADALPLEINADKVTFPWFPLGKAAETKAYTSFIQAICAMAINQKHISSKEKVIVNEKYEFRCFLLRLGMIGEGYKKTRKILMRNLSGSAAFKSVQKKDGEQ